jgi:hypothetical protein
LEDELPDGAGGVGIVLLVQTYEHVWLQTFPYMSVLFTHTSTQVWFEDELPDGAGGAGGIGIVLLTQVITQVVLIRFP